jgi:hypothetical protein
VNPILAVDQPEAQQRISKKALARNNPLDPDYVSGSSPFVVKERRYNWTDLLCTGIFEAFFANTSIFTEVRRFTSE